MLDKKAKRLLFSMFWTSEGWRRPPLKLPLEDYQYLVDRGVAFTSETISHNKVIQRLNEALAGVHPVVLGSSLLASLSTRRLELRAAFHAYVTSPPIEPHKPRGKGFCDVCWIPKKSEYDFTKMNSHRYKFGGASLFFVMDNAWILERWLAEEKPTPVKADLDIFRTILGAADSLEPSNGPTQLKKKIAPLLKSNDQERHLLIEMLGWAGILLPQDLSDEALARVPARSDWTDPVSVWKGADGVNPDPVRHYFPKQADYLLKSCSSRRKRRRPRHTIRAGHTTRESLRRARFRTGPLP